MSKARNLADLLDASGDVSTAALDNVPPNTALVDSSDNTVLDTSSGVLSANGQIVTGANGISMQDNERLYIGNGDDLQIWHDGSNSYIQDVNTGDLRIKGADVVIQQSNGENQIASQSGGAVSLSHNGSTKLATTSTGISVSGQTFTKKPYMQVQTTGSRAYPSGFSDVFFDLNLKNYNCNHNSNYFFEFYKTGIYRITVSYRYGDGGDVWNTNRMYNANNGRELGVAHATGQTNGTDPATNHFEYFIDVQDADLFANAGNAIKMQWYRLGSGFTMAGPAIGAPALVVTVEYISDL